MSSKRVRSTIPSIAISGAVIAAVAVLSGCGGLPGGEAGISGTCTSPAFVHSAAVDNQAIQYEIRVQPDPADSHTTWVCYRSQSGSLHLAAGRISATTASVAIATPSIDTNSRACTTTAGNLLPGSHPIQDGTVVGTPFYVDAYGTPSGLWICVEAGNVKQRVLIPAPGTPPGATVMNDPDAPPLDPPPPPPSGKKSSACYEGRHGSPTEVLNSRLGGQQVFLYTAQRSSSEIHVCARLEGSVDGGVDLGVNASPGQIVELRTSSDTSACTQDIVTIGNPPTSLKITPVGQSPPAVCLNGTSYSVATGTLPPKIVDPQIDNG